MTPVGMTIDELILVDDKRGISALAPHVPRDSCRRSAQRILDSSPKPVMIVTGFYEIKPGEIETDGPPGALAIGRAVSVLGYEAIYITDRYAARFLEAELEGEAEVIDFPITDSAASQAFADELLLQRPPAVVIAVERCGVTATGQYLNMSGQDLTPYTARTDYLFNGSATIGVGDGGNEIGMGAVADVIKETPQLPDEPAITRTDEVIICSVSNWGAYGLVAALSSLAETDLLPSVEAESELITRMTERGAVDGAYLTPMAAVDGFSLEENARVLESLRHAET